MNYVVSIKLYVVRFSVSVLSDFLYRHSVYYNKLHTDVYSVIRIACSNNIEADNI